MEFIETLTPAHLICLAGVALLACWLLRTSLGRRALADSAPRRNNMPSYTPFIPLFFWFGPMPLAILAAGKLAGDLQNWQGYFLDRLIYCIGAMVTVALIIFLARASFARRLKGFGLNVKTAHKDLLAASVNLLAVWPLVMAAIVLTVFFGELIWGGEYQLQQHQELELITEYSRLPLRVSIVIAAVVAAPVVEEMLFRGLFQTMLRSYLETQNSKFKIQNSGWRVVRSSACNPRTLAGTVYIGRMHGLFLRKERLITSTDLHPRTFQRSRHNSDPEPVKNPRPEDVASMLK